MPTVAVVPTKSAGPGSGKATLYANSSGNLCQINPTVNTGQCFFGGSAVDSATPADPITGTTSTTFVMTGLARTITPTTTGRVAFLVSGVLTNSTATAGDGGKAQITYGTGSAPANGAAVPGTATQVGNVAQTILERATASDSLGISCTAIVTTLTVGTTYWYDLAIAATTGGTAVPKQLSVAAIEF